MTTEAEFASTVARIEHTTGHTPTKYQLNIFRAIISVATAVAGQFSAVGHFIVNAVAGSGKTTTLMQAMLFIPSRFKVLMVAFNKHIADELGKRIATSGINHAKAQTLHSVGFAALKRTRKFIKVTSDKTRYICADVMGGYDQMNNEQRKEYYAIAGPVCRMVSLLKNFGYGTHLRPLADKDEVFKLAARYDVELPDEIDTFCHILESTYRLSIERRNSIDFDDMLFLPIFDRCTFPHYDYVFVDESQDLNPIQIAIVKELVGTTGRAVFVGDRNQAIYGFRGADPEAMDTIKQEFNAKELPLSICWRCPTSVVDAAKEIVPQIEASPKAKAGSVTRTTVDKFVAEVNSGDYVLCRVTAPLAGYCLKLIRAGRKAIVRGRDIGQNLTAILGKIEKSKTSGELLDQIMSYGEGELAKLNKPGKESQYIALSDKVATLSVLSEGLDNFDALRDRINQIFSDTDAGVVFSTVHKAKGLEADKVFILQPQLMPHPLAKQPWQVQQEHNLRYVAITRAMQHLVWIDGDANPTADSKAQNENV
jgi:DNA helicase-2/ATP-dependent DNA helicase PcrA